MEILKVGEFPGVLPVRPGRDTKLRIMLLQVKVGETLFMPASEWQRKKPPYNVVARVKKTHGFVFEYGIKPDKSGWLFRRVK